MAETTLSIVDVLSNVLGIGRLSAEQLASTLSGPEAKKILGFYSEGKADSIFELLNAKEDAANAKKAPSRKEKPADPPVNQEAKV